MLFGWSIMKEQCCPWCIHVILLTPVTRTLAGQPRNSTAQWDAGSLVITSISSKLVRMAYGWTVANFLGLLVPLQPCPKVIGVNPLSGLGINIYAVHVDIAFVNSLSIGGFWYALILVDQATHYNWSFGLKNLSSASILKAFCLFRALAGSLAHYFYSDCDLKLFGMAIQEYLIDGFSKIVAAPAGCQLSNGLVKSHWKVMVQWPEPISQRSRCLGRTDSLLLLMPLK
jgi:hypothetical protein